MDRGRSSTKHEHDSQSRIRGIHADFLNNDDVEKLITMKDTMEALEILYRELGEGIAVGARSRISMCLRPPLRMLKLPWRTT